MSGIDQTAAGAPSNPDDVPSTRWRRFYVWRFPVTAGCCGIAVAITLASALGVDIEPLEATAQIGHGQVWRLVTSAFVHVAFFHLLFNVVWMLDFGALVESRLGSLRTAGIVLVLAFASSAAEYAVLRGGIGLSGVVYGLFGLLWMLSRNDARFAGVMTRSMVRTLIVWFFICIALTVAGLFRVANLAHGAGFATGALIGLAMSTPRGRPVFAAGTVLMVLAGLWGSTMGRDLVNLSGSLGEDEARLGYEALVAHRDRDGLAWLLEATQLRPDDAPAWNNLAVAYGRLGMNAQAEAAAARARQAKGGEN